MNPEPPSDYDDKAPAQSQATTDPAQYVVAQSAVKGKPWAAIVAVISAAVSLLLLLPFLFYNLAVANDPSTAPLAYMFFILVPVAFLVVPTTAITAMIMAAIAKPNASKNTKVLLLVTHIILALDALTLFLIL